ncbi:hypothetical protein BC832DRAFT_567728 [Gaertneriomyces semiglobifer]|nr:hypothetical protein BC832DRAFT_567728 [Gaertneriomyces semiglobifer]
MAESEQNLEQCLQVAEELAAENCENPARKKIKIQEDDKEQECDCKTLNTHVKIIYSEQIIDENLHNLKMVVKSTLESKGFVGFRDLVRYANQKGSHGVAMCFLRVEDALRVKDFDGDIAVQYNGNRYPLCKKRSRQPVGLPLYGRNRSMH